MWVLGRHAAEPGSADGTRHVRVWGGGDYCDRRERVLIKFTGTGTASLEQPAPHPPIAVLVHHQLYLAPCLVSWPPLDGPHRARRGTHLQARNQFSIRFSIRAQQSSISGKRLEAVPYPNGSNRSQLGRLTVSPARRLALVWAPPLLQAAGRWGRVGPCNTGPMTKVYGTCTNVWTATCDTHQPSGQHEPTLRHR